MSKLSDYKIAEQVYANASTLIQRAVRLCDQQSVILRSINNPYPTTKQLSRFTYSYELLKRFAHLNIIQVLDWIETDKSPVMVLEDQHAIDLRQYRLAQKKQQLSIEQFIFIGTQLADALYEIHHHRIIHKDLHPGNILISPESGIVQVIDFGLSSLLSREQPALKPPEQIEGVLDYISPEQTGRMNRGLDYRSDFYSLGIIFYELLSGHVPFSGQDTLAKVHNHIAKQQKPLTGVRYNAPPALSQIINKLMAKSAEDRYQSALGLKYDLEKVFEYWQQGDNKTFKLGSKDISQQFHIPQGLYGREQESGILLESYQHAVAGEPQIVVVTGLAGMGKSSLINELHKPIAEQQGLFFSGKFEQYVQNTPYSAIKQAFSAWLAYALALSKSELRSLKDKLQQALEGNAGVLVDFMAELEKVLGVLPERPSLAPSENQNRLHWALCQFTRCISQDRPLLVFIDDLQWADHATLLFLQELMQEKEGHFIILLAYREHEVGENHPTMIALRKIQQLQTISLWALSQADVEQLLSDALFQSRKAVSSLASIVQQRTGGSPFFILEFLKHIFNAGMLDFDITQQCWLWDLKRIKTEGVTKNVVELLLNKIQQLPLISRHLLHVAACLGSQFSLFRLAIAADISVAECSMHLWPSLESGFLIQEAGDWSIGKVRAVDLKGISPCLCQKDTSPLCRFSHDRVLQAALTDLEEVGFRESILDEIIPDKPCLGTSGSEHTHLMIGRRFLACVDQGNTALYLAVVLKQLNKARFLILEPDERLELARLNAQAAQAAKQVGSWEAAGNYAEIGRELLPSDTHLHHQLTYKLDLIRAECAALNGDIDKAENIYQVLMREVNSDLERAQLCLNQLLFFFGQGKWEKAITIGEKGLSFCGLSVPKTEQLLELALADTEHQLAYELGKTPISRIHQLPEMQNPIEQVAMSLLVNMGLCNMVIGNKLYLKLYTQQALILTFMHGKTDLSALVLAIYAYSKGVDEQFQQAVEAAEQALSIMETYPNCREASNVLNLISVGVLHYQKPLQQVRELHQQGYQRGLLSGEIMRAVINLGNELHLQFCQGDQLQKLKQAAEQVVNIAESHKQFYPVALFWLRLSQSLLKRDAYALSDADFEPLLLESTRKSLHIALLDHVRMQYAFWSNKPTPERLASIQQAASTLSRFLSVVVAVDHHLITGLTLIEILAEESESEKAQECSNLLKISLNKIETLAEFCPANFAHKHYLLEAEKLRLQAGSPWRAMPYYQQAIESAKEQGFVQYQALANELCGTFCLRQNNLTMGVIYLREALYLYEKWGCQVRIDELRQRYADLLKSGTLDQHIQSVEDKPDHQSYNLAAITQTSQAISREVQMDKLLNTIIHIFIEQSGAQIAALVLNRRIANQEANPTIEAYLNTLSGQREFLQTENLDMSLKLPATLIQSVLHSDEGLLIAVDESNEQNEPYLKVHQPKSLLCLPIDHHKGIVGAVYLEHRTQAGLFTDNSIELISLLVAQAAISLENASLFSDIQKLSHKLEDKVKKRSSELQSANEALHHLATRDSLTGMFNRRHFMDCGELAFEAAEAGKQSLAVMIMDIDHFKQVNDNYGHPAGDEVLIEVSQLCQSLLRRGDILGRLGGEEFGILLPDTREQGARDWAQCLVESIRPIEVKTEKGVIKITMSVGLCFLPFPQIMPLAAALQRADEVLYQAKEGGRDQVRTALAK